MYNEQNNQILLLDNYLALLWRYKLLLICCFSVSILISIFIYFFTPKEYKATTTISIQSAFFSAPLASELIPSIQDPTEINAERNSLLEKALAESFIDQLATRFDIYTTQPNTRARGTERALFRKKIESFKSGSGFQINVNSNNANQAYQLVKNISKHFMEVLKEYRSKQLLKAEKVVEERVDLLSQVLATSGDEKAKQKYKSNLEEQKAKVLALRSKFTDQHPILIKELEKEADLELALSKLSPKEKIKVPKGFSIDTVRPGGNTNQALYAELVNILSRLKILISMESDNQIPSYVSIVSPAKIPLLPFKPQKERFIALGFIAGLSISGIIILILERRKLANHRIDDSTLAKIFNAPLLGSLPPYDPNKGHF